jgi:hypothetical protein
VAQAGARTLGLSAAGTALRMETFAGTFDPLLTETLAHMFRLDKDLSPRTVRGRRFTTARVPA